MRRPLNIVCFDDKVTHSVWGTLNHREIVTLYHSFGIPYILLIPKLLTKRPRSFAGCISDTDNHKQHKHKQ